MKRDKTQAKKASAERTENKGMARRRTNCTRRMGEPILLMVLIVVLLQSVVNVHAIQLLWTESDSASEERVPDPPANVRVEQLTSNSATIRWDHPRNIDKVVVRGYTLSYGADSTEARRIVLEGAETTEYALNGLRPNTTYAVSLTAYNEAEGEDSVRVLLLVRTPPLLARDTPETEDGTEALRPRDLRIERRPQKDAALLRWEEPMDGKGQRPLYYVISYASVAHPQSVRRMSAERSPALISDIKAEEKYTVKVRAIFADGTQSGWSEKVTTDGTRKNETSRKFGGGGRRNGNEEENFCGFELSSICDYIREGQWRWQRRNSTRDGYSMVLNESLSSAVPSSAVGAESLVPLGLPPLLSAPPPPPIPSHHRQFGRLMSPVYELRPSDTFCLSAQLKVAKGAFGALFRLGVHFEGDPRPLWLFRKSLQRVWPPGEWVRLSFQLRRRPPTRAFQSKETELATFVLLLDNVSVRAANCPPELEPYFGAAPDEETEANLLIPLENLIDTDPRVYRTSGLDGLPAVGIKRGVEIVVPYRIYLPRKFYRNFAILASIRPADHLGGYLFAVLNAFDTVVELGVQLQPAGPSQTNISLLYTNSHAEHDSRALVSFLVPAFTGQWTQFALEVHEQSVGLYFRCMRFAIRQVIRLPAQLQMDDASKLYIANAGPILGGGFEVSPPPP
ncbi:hypothetical protein niasHT_030464 [Heterodera trifolii]|uniref:Uncharacterized protein n=1 Tax=Heterodera trifolii TaxID=157864 RepID=A0ABD2J622_9BILA